MPNIAALAFATVSALLMLAWDLSGLDLALTRLFGDARGFAARDSAWASLWVHEGGRVLALAVLAALVLAALRQPQTTMGSPSCRERWFWIGVVVLCAVAVPALKRISSTSCPWDLAEFGGAATYVSHWRFGVDDGGSGRCFPSGHAVSAFALLGQYFLWRPHNRRRAHAWLTGVLLFGALFSVTQLLRGAHHLSHSLWSAWLCWALCSSAAACLQRTMLARRPCLRAQTNDV